MRLLQWNVQWCCGMDGRVDPARIARVAKELCDPDIVCFQEVADNYESLAGSSGEDQPELLKNLFAGYSAHFACAVDVPDGKRGRRRFGNMILSRLPVRRVLRHSLPWPPEDGVPSMPRVAIEAAVQAPWGLVGVTTTHLEAYSVRQRAAQVERLRGLETEKKLHSSAIPANASSSSVFEHWARPASSILTGDFNMPPQDPICARLLETWRDAWQIAHPGVPHPPSFHVHDEDGETAPYCCDFVFVSADLAARVSKVDVNSETDASDHQPVIVEFS
jgi:endonuclease/exonuclease/phosphatase family metal-dependent hydrolase